MLERREFLKLSTVLAAGAVLTFSAAGEILAADDEPETGQKIRPPLRYRGHARSGCAFRPELSAVWAGGGAQLPDDF